MIVTETFDSLRAAIRSLRKNYFDDMICGRTSETDAFLLHHYKKAGVSIQEYNQKMDVLEYPELYMLNFVQKDVKFTPGLYGDKYDVFHFCVMSTALKQYVYPSIELIPQLYFEEPLLDEVEARVEHDLLKSKYTFDEKDQLNAL